MPAPLVSAAVGAVLIALLMVTTAVVTIKHLRRMLAAQEDALLRALAARDGWLYTHHERVERGLVEIAGWLACTDQQPTQPILRVAGDTPPPTTFRASIDADVIEIRRRLTRKIREDGPA